MSRKSSVLDEIFSCIPNDFKLQASCEIFPNEEIPAWISKIFDSTFIIISDHISRKKFVSYNKVIPISQLPKSTNFDQAQEVTHLVHKLSIVKDFVWESLNIGHWKDVKIIWRILYSYNCFLNVALLALLVKNEDDIDSLVKICDDGILMGYPIFNNILSLMAKKISQVRIKDKTFSTTPENTQNYENHYNSSTSTISLLREKLQNVPEIEVPSIEYFLQNHFTPQQPAVLLNTIQSWPALSKWNPAYISHIAGSRTVPVELGSKYTSNDWTQKLMTIKEFVNIYMQPDSASKVTGYLAQHKLFDQIPDLMSDIRTPEYCYLSEVPDEIEINAWFGPANTLTPTHWDPNHNLLAQVFGTKFIRLFPPSESCNLYPHNSDSLLFNTSQVDFEDHLALDSFPNISKAIYSDIVLKPGSVLYIPPKWWHMVKSLSPSFSVSFWFK